MHSSFRRILEDVGREALRAIEGGVRDMMRQSGDSGTRDAAGRRPVPANTHGGEPSPYGSASAREINLKELPDFDYAPHDDGDADPGEVVWTWVPFEDIPEVGKDRPVLVLARASEDDVVVIQLTSKDHDFDAADEARYGRYWFDIGTGDWDRQGRPSEVRIDRLLRVGQPAIRREGGRLGRKIFGDVVAAVSVAHEQGL